MVLQPQQWMPYAMPALLAWVVYRRVRGHFGPQAWKPKRTAARIVLLAIAAMALVAAAVVVPHAALPMAVGLAVGLLLAGIGLRHTHAEWRGGVRTYIPNPWVGGVLTAVLVARLAWRFTQGGGLQGAQQPSALTLAVAATLVAYAVCYSIGLVLRMRALGGHPPRD